MIARILILTMLFGFSHLRDATLLSADTQTSDTIKTINHQLQAADNKKERARLYCYRARNYAESGDNEQAKNDYLAALNSSYEGWILNELGYFMYKTGQYEKAYNVAVRVLKDFPYLQKEAGRLKTQAKQKWEEEYLKNNPPTISIDSRPDPNRVSRHDLIRQGEAEKTYNGGRKGDQSSKPISEHWGKHPATKNIPVPKQRNYDF